MEVIRKKPESVEQKSRSSEMEKQVENLYTYYRDLVKEFGIEQQDEKPDPYGFGHDKAKRYEIPRQPVLINGQSVNVRVASGLVSDFEISERYREQFDTIIVDTGDEKAYLYSREMARQRAANLSLDPLVIERYTKIGRALKETLMPE